MVLVAEPVCAPWKSRGKRKETDAVDENFEWHSIGELARVRDGISSVHILSTSANQAHRPMVRQRFAARTAGSNPNQLVRTRISVANIAHRQRMSRGEVCSEIRRLAVAAFLAGEMLVEGRMTG